MYEFKTTFWQDFTIADHFGLGAIQDTYNRAFKEWREMVDYLAELVLVLNHKIWEHYDNGNMAMARLYDKLWRECDEWACNNLKGDDLQLYYRITD